MPRLLASCVLLILCVLFVYGVTTRTGLMGGAPRYYPPTEESQRAHAELMAHRAAATRAS